MRKNYLEYGFQKEPLMFFASSKTQWEPEPLSIYLSLFTCNFPGRNMEFFRGFVGISLA
jgi:hypothetical protein